MFHLRLGDKQQPTATALLTALVIVCITISSDVGKVLAMTATVLLIKDHNVDYHDRGGSSRNSGSSTCLFNQAVLEYGSNMQSIYW